MEGDDGGQIYRTCPVRHIAAGHERLNSPLRDIDEGQWKDASSASLHFEKLSVGQGVPDGLWVYLYLENLRERIQIVIDGCSNSINLTS